MKLRLKYFVDTTGIVPGYEFAGEMAEPDSTTTTAGNAGVTANIGVVTATAGVYLA